MPHLTRTITGTIALQLLCGFTMAASADRSALSQSELDQIINRPIPVMQPVNDDAAKKLAAHSVTPKGDPFPIFTVITVDTLADVDNNNLTPGDVSLREAIRFSNLQGNTPTINFAPALTSGGPATISLTSGSLPIIAQPVIVNGPGANLLSVSGRDAARVFEIANLTSVTMTGLTIRDGVTTSPTIDAVGGGFRVRGDLTLNNCKVTSNTAAEFGGGIYLESNGSLILSHCEIIGNDAKEGAGIRHTSNGALSVSDSLITSNTARSISGGMDIFQGNGPVQIVRTTISRNVALTLSGGFYTDHSCYIADCVIENNVCSVGAGGGVVLAGGGMTTVTNCTISNNTAAAQGGGIFANTGVTTATLQNVTITGNSAIGPGSVGDAGGIFTQVSKLLVSNTVIAGNTDGTTQDLNFPDMFGAFTSLGHNFIGNAGTTPTLVNGVNADQIGYTTAPLSALLGPLANNGGPTRTHHPLNGSPLIDSGDNSRVTAHNFIGPAYKDQRGAPRVRQLAVDIGAVEVQPAPVAMADAYAAFEDLQLIIEASGGVLDNDYFLEAAELVSSPAHGTVALAADGSFTYDSAQNYYGIDTFTYRSKDVLGQFSPPVAVTISISPINDAPVIAVPGAKTTAEDTQLNITGISVSDVDSATSNVTINLAVSHGTITLAAGVTPVTGNGTAAVQTTGSVAQINARLATVRYQPAPDYNGPDVLALQLNDLGNTGFPGPLGDVDNINITVTPVSDAHLTIDKSAVAQVSDIGSTITYTILVTNTGSEPTQSGVVIVDTPPSGLTFVSATASSGAVTSGPAVTDPFYQLFDTVGPLAPAASETFTLVFTTDGAGVYINGASATSIEGTVSDEVTVNLCPAAAGTSGGDCNTLPDLTATWTTPPTLVKGKLKGKALVTNQGGVDALNATAVIVVSGDGCPGGSDLAVTTKLLKKLKPGKSKKINLSYKVLDPAVVSGKVAIIWVNGVSECNETNNFATAGPLP